MREKRTEIDFSKHELIITKNDDTTVYHLKKPNTVVDSIMYINTNGIMAVKGDYGNWIFCREFHPSAKEFASDGYWKEKLKINSCQEPSKYDSERTEQEIREMLEDKDGEHNWSDEDIEYLQRLLRLVDDEIDYKYEAYRNDTDRFDYDNIPYVKTIHPQFLYILDGFDEMCRRMEKHEEQCIIKDKAVLIENRSIEFAEWIDINHYINSSDDLWYKNSDGAGSGGLTTRELYYLFISKT